MNYRDTLPDDCPPCAAEEVDAPRVVFRLVSNVPPTSDDFRSQRQQNPNRRFTGVTECQACGLSIFSNKHDAATKLLKLPRFKNHKLCRVMLSAGSGRIQQTFQPSHHTWWPRTTFNILENCSLETV